MNQKFEGKILILLGMKYNEVIYNEFFNDLFESKQLEQIEDRYYLDSPLKGISLTFSSELKIITIHLYSEGVQGFQQDKDNGIDGLKFHMSQKQVHNIFGKPNKSGKAGIDPILGQLFPGNLYQHENTSVHCEYSDDFQKIRLITISIPEYESEK